MTDDRLPTWGWIAAAAGIAGGIALAAVHPGSFAFWVAPVPSLIGLAVIANALLSPPEEMPPERWRVALIAAVVLAVAAIPLVILDPGDRAYILASFLLQPFVVLLLIRSKDGEGAEGTAGPFDLPGP